MVVVAHAVGFTGGDGGRRVMSSGPAWTFFFFSPQLLGQYMSLVGFIKVHTVAPGWTICSCPSSSPLRGPSLTLQSNYTTLQLYSPFATTVCSITYTCKRFKNIFPSFIINVLLPHCLEESREQAAVSF